MTIKSKIIFLVLAVTVCAVPALGQKQANFIGHWNWAIYATSKPPAYKDMDLKEVPAWALDVTIKQRGQRLSGSFGIVAHARVDEGSFSTTINGNRATIKLRSNFGGSAIVMLTLKGDQLAWKVIRSTDQNYFPKDEVLRRLRRGERPPYAADDR